METLNPKAQDISKLQPIHVVLPNVFHLAAHHPFGHGRKQILFHSY